MRVTNGMIRNNMLNALHTNMSRLDKLYNQMNTQKKIQRPSDDPIVAGRSLKLRINVLEAEQYKSNTSEATSWMDITETALGNITKIIKDIRTKCNYAANDPLGTDDRQKLLTDIDQLAKQVAQESNVTYAGRYVFSGYKTDEPVVLQKTTTLTEETGACGEMTLLKGTKIPTSGIFLPGGAKLSSGAIVAPGTTLSNPPPATPTPPYPSISATGVLEEDIVLQVTTTIPTGDKVLAEAATIQNPLTGITAGDVLLPDGTKPTTLTVGTVLPAGTIIRATATLPTTVAPIKFGTILPAGTELPEGTVNPKVLGRIEGQSIQYEIGVGSTININTLGMDSFMKDFLAQVKDIKDGIANGSNLHDLFNGKLGKFDDSLSDISEMNADLGSRMARLEYTASRLTDDATNLKELLLNTEGVDLEDTYVDFNSQYQVYQSALQATSKVIMNTLADFLR